MIFRILALFLVLLSGCSKKTPAKEECEVLSMHAYRGLPDAAHQFEQDCKGYQLKYTKDLCAKALVDLVQFGDQNTLEKKFGPKVMECFTANDLRNFLKK